MARIAKEWGVPPQNLYRLASSEVDIDPRLSTLDRLAESLGVDSADLIKTSEMPVVEDVLRAQLRDRDREIEKLKVTLAESRRRHLREFSEKVASLTPQPAIQEKAPKLEEAHPIPADLIRRIADLPEAHRRQVLEAVEDALEGIESPEPPPSAPAPAPGSKRAAKAKP